MWSSLGSWLPGLWTTDSEADPEDAVLLHEAQALLVARQVVRERREGTVTSVHDEYCIVDGELYWNVEKNPPQDIFRERMEKQQAAAQERKSLVNCHQNSFRKYRYVLERFEEEAHLQWKLVQVEELCIEGSGDKNRDFWQQDFPDSSTSSVDVVAEVVAIRKQAVQIKIVNADNALKCADLKREQLLMDHMPWRGDLLQLRVDPNGCPSAIPLRYTEDTGSVSMWKDHMGLIDEKVFFTEDACSSSFYPRSKDRVRYKAVECNAAEYNFGCNWRAIRVLPRNDVFRQKPFDFDHATYSTNASKLEELLSAKFGVSATLHPCEFRSRAGEAQVAELRVENTSKVPVELIGVSGRCTKKDSDKIDCSRNLISLRQEHALPLVIGPGNSTKVLLECTGNVLGKTREILVLNFASFQIGQAVDFVTSHEALGEFLNGSERSVDFGQRDFRSPLDRDEHFVPGQRKKGGGGRTFGYHLKEFAVPKSLQRAAINRQNDEILDESPCLAEPLTPANFSAKLSALLHLEEMAVGQSLCRFDMGEAVLHHVGGEFLSLDVPGLAEKRPSLMMGDSAVVCVHGQTTRFEGCVHEVRSASVLLKFDRVFHDTYHSEVCSVSFFFNRGAFKRMHHAVHKARQQFGDHVLFPQEVLTKPPEVDLLHFLSETETSRAPKKLPPSQSSTRPRKTLNVGLWSTPVLPLGFASNHPITLKSLEKTDLGNQKYGFFPKESATLPPYTPKVPPRLKAFKGSKFSLFNPGLNREQRRAVLRILAAEARPMPYIIYGPPGTGKTMTLVEAVLQTFHRKPSSRILVAAPSNSAADLIAERLHRSGVIHKGQMARLNAFQRDEASVPEIIRPYCCANQDTESLSLAVRSRIVVSTASTAGALQRLGLGRGFFTHCFLDEAGHLTEPETLVPLGLVDVERAQVVLAGDPRQLGPVLQSNFAKLYGLEESLLERLCRARPYQRDSEKFRDHGGYDPLLVTKLCKNYRSHEQIISLPSLLFYDNELEACADKAVKRRFLGKAFLSNPEVPILFHGIRGCSYQEGDDPSWFNPSEVLQATIFLKLLYEDGVRPEEMGIIAPYRKQVAKIRQMIDALQLPEPKVGSVEEFQGQERSVIIINTVRSSTGSHEDVAMDVFHGLGFLQSEKRFNVAVTRAKSLLIVIGDPHLLIRDETWRKFLLQCHADKTYQGCDLPLEVESCDWN